MSQSSEDTETETQADAAASEANVDDNKPDSVRRVTLVVLAIGVVFFLWYVIADRITPSTNQARVRGYVVPIAPEVSGVISEVKVGVNAVVEKDQKLIILDPAPFEIALMKAEADLEKAGQDIGAGTANVSSAQARLVDARAVLKSTQLDANRMFAVEDIGVFPQADIDRARARVEQAKAQVSKAEADLLKAKQELGEKGQDNPKIQVALAALAQARLNLSRTMIRAPSFGGVTNLRVDAGQYANTGQPLMTFVSTKDVWIEAFMRENSLGNIMAGDQVEIALDVAPGRVFSGKVVSIGYGVKWDKSGSSAELPTVPGKAGWLRDPQRFPVIIKFSGDEASGFRREGGQADVIVYTGGNMLFNAIGWVQIRLASLISYVY